MSEVAGERRVVSVLITDVVDSTAIGERLGPERSKFLFDEISRLVERAVHAFGGTVAQHTGDGVLALFGAPVAHEDDAERAVRAALAMHEALSAFGRELGEAYGIEVVARAAINTGPVTLPREDAPADVLYNALGDTVNVAARLQSHARPGGVVLGPLTVRQVDQLFELEALGELQLKGRSEPVPASRVVGERSPDIARPTTLVGRARELDEVERVFAELVDGRGAIVCVTGEPGIGKSRLAAEAKLRAGENVRFLEGHGVAYAENIPYWPVRELLRGWLDLGMTEPEARVRLELRTALARTLGDDADDAYPFLATLLGASPPAEDAALLLDLSNDSVRRQTHDAVQALVAAVAREGPLCLVLDDLHWADEATLDLADELLGASEDQAVVLLLLYRSERDHRAWRLAERARQRYPHRYLELELQTLDGTASRSLAVEAAGAELPEEVSTLLADRSGGNPYFLEQALRDLVESGALDRRGGEYVLADGATPSVPAAVQEALQARLDRLAPDVRELVGAASVIGRVFAAPLLERLAPGVQLAAALSDLQRLDLIVEERRRPAPEYRFRHGLLQEVAYGSLLEGRRRSLHQAAGLALEVLNVDGVDEVAGLLAHHFVEADDAERAARYLVSAGDAARRLYANPEALEHYQRAVPFLDRIGDDRVARDILLRVGLTLLLSSDFAAANEAYRQAFARSSSPDSGVVPTERLVRNNARPEAVVPGHTFSQPGWDFARHLYRGLLAVDGDLNVLPDLARSFEVSPDGLIYRFSLEPGQLWSDGQAVAASDFARTWQSMRAEDVKSASMLSDVSRAEALDDHTLEVELVAPRTYFPYLCAMPPLFPWPMHVVDRLGPDWHRAPDLVGNGPYVLAAFDERHAVLRANPAWRRFAGNVAEVEIRFDLPEGGAAAWRRGELDLASSAFLEPVEDLADTTFLETRSVGTGYVAFLERSRSLDDVRVRRALAISLDHARLVESLRSSAPLIARGGLIPPSMPGHSHRLDPSDGSTARELLAAAGFANADALPELTLVALNEDSRFAELGTEIAARWGEVGFRVNLVLAPLQLMDDAVREADAVASVWVADYPDPDGMLGTMLESNPGIRRTAETEELLLRARSATDPDERSRLYRELDRLLVVEVVSLVPTHYVMFRLCHRPWVHGLRPHAIAEHTPYDQLVVERPQNH